MWRQLRILILLLILLFVAVNTWLDRVYATDWDATLRVAVYPINGDGSARAEAFIRDPATEDFTALERFFAREATKYGVELEQPVRFMAGPPLKDTPPAIAPGANFLQVALWSLRTRYWASRAPDTPAPPDVKLFVLYHDPSSSPRLPHSTGLQKGLFAIVHAFADRAMQGSNEVVMAHELLHTLGATDKYDPATGHPTHPIGFAEPDRTPLYPQTHAELMGGRIPRSPTSSEIPESLNRVVVGPATALEIGWLAK